MASFELVVTTQLYEPIRPGGNATVRVIFMLAPASRFPAGTSSMLATGTSAPPATGLSTIVCAQGPATVVVPAFFKVKESEVLCPEIALAGGAMAVTTRSTEEVAFAVYSKAPISGALPVRANPRKSVATAEAASPASIKGEPAAGRKSSAAAFTKSGLTEMLPFWPAASRTLWVPLALTAPEAGFQRLLFLNTTVPA